MLKNTDKYEQEITRLKNELEKYKTAVAELNTLNELAIAAGRAFDVDQMLNIIVKKTTRTLNAEQGSIMLVTQDKDGPLKTYLHQKEMTTSRETYHIGSEITGWVLKHEEALIIDDLLNDKRFDLKKDNTSIHSLLCVPLWFEGKIIGLLTMINKKGEKQFSKNDFTLLSIISVQAGQLIKNLQLQKESFIKQKEAEKLQELDIIKTNFFNNISHEFRSPLTLILGPLEKLLEQEMKADSKSKLELIHNNAHRLLRLINQLLDLATIDAGKMKLRIERADIITFIKGIAVSYHLLAESKNISLKFESNLNNYEAYFDKDKIEKIITNLVSNAIKFTNENGEILISFRELPGSNEINYEIIEIIIEDNGIGISTEEIKNIFDRFNKAESFYTTEGSGIGLALVKELTELHFGSVSVESKLNKGTKFIIRLPVSREFYLNNQIDIQLQDNRVPVSFEDKIFLSTETKNKKQSKEELPIILIVEDQDEIRNFIRENLVSQYQIIETSNGKEGLEKSLEVIPDLIISDVLMPEMDGIELTKKIKNDFKTDHIPVILLTAQAAIENKLQGLETGADDYLTKPFSVNELTIRVNNLVKQRKKLRERYKKEITLEPKDIPITSKEEKFLNRALEIIEQHISDPGFSVEQFASEIFMSRVQLHRKFVALTDQSPSEFIRIFRLKRGAKLLLNKHGNISEIAYDVGFNNPSYFTESFKKYFGCSPFEYYKTRQTENSK
jgi:signal transduction histidine kinase/DNA-binding response OmpR family regulator